MPASSAAPLPPASGMITTALAPCATMPCRPEMPFCRSNCALTVSVLLMLGHIETVFLTSVADALLQAFSPPPSCMPNTSGFLPHHDGPDPDPEDALLLDLSFEPQAATRVTARAADAVAVTTRRSN